MEEELNDNWREQEGKADEEMEDKGEGICGDTA